MKIPLSIRRAYEEQEDHYKRLKELVDKKIKALIDSRWHYVSRIKEITSYCLKLESGRFEDLKNMEDYFACTIVVTSAAELETAQELIQTKFDIKAKRPKSANFTLKDSNSFPFDDLRLHICLKSDPALPPTGLEGTIFELQLKTFLQHAWAISTHDLVYKTDDVHWSKERIAYQIKAMLEHAELSIYEAEKISQSKLISKCNKKMRNINKMIEVLRSQWEQTDLPSDLRRLSDNILLVLMELDIKVSELKVMLLKASDENKGILPTNLSPYGVIIQTVMKQKKTAFFKHLTQKDDGNRKLKILIPAEIELPPDISRSDCVNAIFVGNGT